MRRISSASPLGVRAHHDAVGMQKLIDRRAFAQKFGVRDDIELLRLHAMAVQHTANPFAGMDRHRTLFHNHLVAVDGAGNLRDHGLDIRKVGGAVLALRRAHGDEDGLAALDGCAQIGGKAHAALAVPGQQLRQMALKDRHAALAQSLHLGFVIVHADHLVPYLRKANGSHQSHITGADHTDRNRLQRFLAISLSASTEFSLPLSLYRMMKMNFAAEEVPLMSVEADWGSTGVFYKTPFR